MTRLSKREKYIFTLAAVIIISAMLCNVVFKPCVNRWNCLNREISIKEVRLKKVSRLFENRDEIIKKYNDRVFLSKGISSILNYIEARSNVLGIKISNIKPKSLPQKQTQNGHEIGLEIEGEAKNIQRFISAMVDPPMSMGLRRFDFRTQPKNPTYLKGTLTLLTSIR